MNEIQTRLTKHGRNSSKGLLSYQIDYLFLVRSAPSPLDWGTPRPCSGAADGRGGVGFCPLDAL